MRALLDADIVAFRAAAAAEKEDEGIARYYADQLIDQLLLETKSDSYNLYLTGDNNFRYQIYPEYKAQRIDMYRPRHLKYVRDYLLSIRAELSDGCEADDLMGIEQCANKDTVIVTLDKDLQMIPGLHYSWEISGVSVRKDKATGEEIRTPWTKAAVWTDTNEDECRRFFWTQVLTGDVADNIKGATGVGKVGASKAFAGCESDADYFEAALPFFSCKEELEMNAACLWIWRKENDIWQIPSGAQ